MQRNVKRQKSRERRLAHGAKRRNGYQAEHGLVLDDVFPHCTAVISCARHGDISLRTECRIQQSNTEPWNCPDLQACPPIKEVEQKPDCHRADDFAQICATIMY